MSAIIELGLLTQVRPLARSLPEPEAPLLSWCPGKPTPEFSTLAWSLQVRFSAPPRVTTCYIATRRATSLFGGRGGGELKHDHQATHDLGLAAVYLHIKEHCPQREPKWLAEDLLRPHYRKQKLPDAVLAASPSARPELVIEFGGAYDRHRLEVFHQDCLKKNLPYEIW